MQSNLYSFKIEITETGDVARFTLDRPEVVADNTQLAVQQVTGQEDDSSTHTFVQLVTRMESDVTGSAAGSFEFWVCDSTTGLIKNQLQNTCQMLILLLIDFT